MFSLGYLTRPGNMICPGLLHPRTNLSPSLMLHLRGTAHRSHSRFLTWHLRSRHQYTLCHKGVGRYKARSSGLPACPGVTRASTANSYRNSRQLLGYVGPCLQTRCTHDSVGSGKTYRRSGHVSRIEGHKRSTSLLIATSLKLTKRRYDSKWSHGLGTIPQLTLKHRKTKLNSWKRAKAPRTLPTRSTYWTPA